MTYRPVRVRGLGQPEPQAEQQQEPAESGSLVPESLTSGQLSTTMVMRGAAGVVVGAAAAPQGKEGIWAAVGFAIGATVGEVGIMGVALAALWRKAG